ncbi:hypothetical protein KKC60_00680 [Patescibacteria group bacterium]|nr:hypothetical protein [Patescibacteria group bacterium]
MPERYSPPYKDESKEERERFDHYMKYKLEDGDEKMFEALSGVSGLSREVQEDLNQHLSLEERKFVKKKKKDFSKKIEEKEKDEFLYFSKEYKTLMEYLGYENVQDLYGKIQISQIPEVKKYKEIKDPISRLEYLDQLEMPEEIACLYSVDDASTIPRIIRFQERMAKYQKMIKDPGIDVYPSSIALGLKRDVFRYSMLGEPEMEIYKKANKWCEKDEISTRHMVRLDGAGAGISSYKLLQEIYHDALKDTKKEHKAEDLTTEKIEDLAVRLGAIWLSKSMEYNLPEKGPTSSFFATPKEAIAWAKLCPRTQERLKFLRQNVSGIDLHNIQRFIGKSEPKKSVERSFHRASRMLNEFDKNPEDKRKELMDELLVKNNNSFEAKIAKIERDEARGAREIWEKVDSKEEAKKQLGEYDEYFKEEKEKIKEAYQTENERIKNLSGEEARNILLQRLEKTRRKRELERPISEKALFLLSLGHKMSERGSYSLSEIDWINTAPFGLINRCYRMHFEGVSEEGIEKYVRLSNSLGDNLANLNKEERAKLAMVSDSVLMFIGRKMTEKEARNVDPLQFDSDDLRSYLENVHLKHDWENAMKDLSDLQDFTGHKFVWTKEKLDDVIYNLSKSGPTILHEIEEVMGKKFPWTQELFDDYAKASIDTHGLEGFEEMEQKLGMKADISQQEVDNYAIYYCRCRHSGELYKIERITGKQVKWTEQMLTKIADGYSVKYNFAKDIEALEKVSGLTFKFSKEFIAKQIMKDGFYETAQALGEKVWEDRTEAQDFVAFARKAFSIQSPASRAEHCPWRNDLKKLISNQTKSGAIDLSSKQGQGMFLKYLKEIGPFNLVMLFPIFTELNREKEVRSLAEETKKLLREFGVKVDKFSKTAEVLNDLKQRKRAMIQGLQKDEIMPKVLTSVIGGEIYQSIIGSTQWSSGRSLAELVRECEHSSKTSPKLFKLPEGYETKTIKIRKQALASEVNQTDKKEEMNRLVEDERTQEIIDREVLPVFEAINVASDEKVESWWLSARKDLADSLESVIDSLQEKLGKMPEAGKERAATQIKAYQDLLTFCSEYTFLEGDDTENSIVKVMEALSEVPLKNNKVLVDTLRKVACFHLIETMPTNYTFMDPFRQPELDSAEKVKVLDNFIKEYLGEHYLHPSKDPIQTYHQPFSKNVYRNMKSIFGLTGDFRKRPLGLLRNKIDAIESSGEVIVENTTDVKLVPVRKMLRVSSGTIGDACFDKQDLLLAKGRWPLLTSIVFVANPETAVERFSGATLLIETKSFDEQPTLLVRANNPSENLLGSVDPDALNAEIIEYAIETAIKRGLKRVVAPLDKVSASCSNRSKVADYYKKNFSKAKKIMLKNTSETNFNDYPVWDANGEYACVEIWHA